MQVQREKTVDVSIEQEMKDSYLRFALSTILTRALPDARDGLKPSQRRILVTMNDQNLGPRASKVKCARIVGDTMGKYHPHGDLSIYQTLVNMAQDFKCRYILIEPQGNFGSMDGDPPAAMRYTEARMTEATVAILEDLDRDTVDLVPNYDDKLMEPSVLPSKFPNLLVNGSTGIAVGMATSIPPHNLSEVCDGIIKVIEDPDCEIEDLMKIIKGPDFPTGALICGRSGIRQGYKTGRGTVITRARAHIESTQSGKRSIVVTEVPYLLNRENLLEKIAKLAEEGKVKGISEVRNETDRDGCRLVIGLRRDADEQVVLNQLYKQSKLQDSFSINMVAVINNRPQTFNLKQLIVAYIDHRKEVIRRRTAFLLAEAEKRAHILEGLLIALGSIDEIIAIMRGSETAEEARDEMMSRFDLTRLQSDAILQMQLRRLTGLERGKLEEEYKNLQEDIKGYRAILGDERLVLDIIREDVYEIKEKHGDDRRSEIVSEVGDFDIEDLIAEERVAVTVSHEGYIKRIPLDTYRAQGRGGKGITGADTKEGDFIEHLFIASTHEYILLFTDKGKLYWLRVYDIPQLGRTSRGRSIVNLVNLEKGEKLTSMIPVREFDDRQLIMVTQKGTIKKTVLEAFSHPQRVGIRAIDLQKDDELIGVRITDGNREIVLATELGMAIRFHEQDVRSMGRQARGVKGITLRGDDKVVGVVIADEDATLLTVCENGYGKRTGFDAYRFQARGGVGVANIKTSERNGKVVGIMGVQDEDELMMMTVGGMIIRTNMKAIRPIGRNTQGVKLISLKEDDKLSSIARVVANGEDDQQSSDSD